MKTDVVYKLGSGSKYDDKELRYSLRSLSYFKGLGKIYIVGHRPNWIQNVIHISNPDVFLANKDANLINKLILASHHPSISEEFLNFSDDQLLMRECSYSDFTTPYYDNSLINFLPDQKLNRWKTRLKNTIRVLKEKGLPANCYEGHIPTLINKKDYVNIVFNYNYPEGVGMCGNTLYFNSKFAPGMQLPLDFSVKLESICPEPDQINSFIKDTVIHFNYASASVNQNLFLYLESKFPNKSIYESD